MILADINLRILGRFCDWAKTSPSKYARMTLTEMQDLAEDYVGHMETAKKADGKPYSPSYVENCLTAVRSWAQTKRQAIYKKNHYQEL